MSKFQEIEAARVKYSQETLETLKSYKVVELRKIAVEVDTKSPLQDGVIVKVNNARKETLALAIYDACDTHRQLAKQAELVEVKADTAIEALNEYHSDLKHNEKFGATIATTWKSLKEDTHRRFDPITQDYRPIDGTFLAIVSTFLKEISAWHSNKPPYELLTEQTKVNYSRQIARIINTDLLAEFENTFRYEAYKDTTENFLKYVKDATKPAMVERRQDDLKRQSKELSDQTIIKGVEAVYDWATGILEKAFKDTLNPRSSWRDVVVALLAVTGRRQSEITSTAIFEVIDDNHVFFKGQLKQRKDNDFTDGYTIPVFAPADHVVSALSWLEKYGKRNPDPKKAHDLFSKYINGAADTALEKLTWVHEPEVDPLQRKGHLFRALYAVSAIKHFHHEDKYCEPTEYARKVLGEKDMITASVYTRKLRIEE